MGETNPKHAAVNALQEPTCGSYNSQMTSSYQVGVIPCMQLPPLAVAVSVLEKHRLHMLLGNWEFLSFPHHHSIHEDNMHAFLSPMQPQANCAISVI